MPLIRFFKGKDENQIKNSLTEKLIVPYNRHFSVKFLGPSTLHSFPVINPSMLLKTHPENLMPKRSICTYSLLHWKFEKLFQ